jgi:hypothetical protein
MRIPLVIIVPVPQGIHNAGKMSSSGRSSKDWSLASYEDSHDLAVSSIVLAFFFCHGLIPPIANSRLGDIDRSIR